MSHSWFSSNFVWRAPKHRTRDAQTCHRVACVDVTCFIFHCCLCRTRHSQIDYVNYVHFSALHTNDVLCRKSATRLLVAQHCECKYFISINNQTRSRSVTRHETMTTPTTKYKTIPNMKKITVIGWNRSCKKMSAAAGCCYQTICSWSDSAKKRSASLVSSKKIQEKIRIYRINR